MYYIMKSELKLEGKAIKELKKEVKEHQRQGAAWRSQLKLMEAKRAFRHKHIAYCELRGTPRGLIEKPRDNNTFWGKPDEDKILRIKEFYLSQEIDLLVLEEAA